LQSLQEAPEGAHPTPHPRGATIGAPGASEAVPLVEGWAGRYQTHSRQPDGSSAGSAGWQGLATLRTPAWRGLRLWGAAETAPQSGALVADALETWQGAELVGGLQLDGWRVGPWQVSPSVAAGGVVALGSDRDRVRVTPTLLAAGARLEGFPVRLYVGLGRHGATSDGLVLIADALVRLPSTDGRLALHSRWISGEAASWRYGIVGRWW